MSDTVTKATRTRRSFQVPQCSLKAKQAVYLVPDDDREADARADHDHHREPEAERRQLPFVRPLFAVPALQALASVLAVNGCRVE